MQFLGRCVGPQRPRVERTEFERAADDTCARLEQRGKYVQVVELRPTIHKIGYARRGAANVDVVACRRRDSDVVCDVQPLHPFG
jgi:hypothetical protein